MSEETAPQEAADGSLTASTTPTPPSTPPDTPTAPEAAKTASEEGKTAEESDGEAKSGISTMDDALKVIADLRKENARQRTSAKEAAANEARQDMAATIARALGYNPEGEEAPDPEEQVRTLTTQIEATRAEAEQAALELAIYRTASTVGANPDALLDSRSFMQTMAKVDAANADAVTEAITTAIKNNPTLKAAQAVGSTRVDHTPGGNGHAEPKSLTEALSARYQ